MRAPSVNEIADEPVRHLEHGVVAAGYPAPRSHLRAWLKLEYLLIGGIGALLVVGNSWWIAQYRASGLFDIDEAGYLATSLEYSIAYARLGWMGLWQSYQGHAPSAPLVPFLASLVYPIFGTHFMFAFGVLVFALVTVAMLSAALAQRLGGRAAAVVATLAVAGTPAMLDQTRTFQFTIAVAACFTGAVMCMAASNRLQRTGLAIAWGALLGLMLLSRTMTIAFVPGFFIAGLLVVLNSPDRRRSVANLALGTVAMLLVASTWYAANWQAVGDYLLGFGYGAQSAPYGGGPLSLSREIGWIERQVNEYLYLPSTLVLLAGGVAGAAITIAAFGERRGSIRARLAWVTAKDWVPMAIPVAAGLAALVSSGNQGVGFIVPLLPVATVLAVVSLSKVPWRRMRVAALSLTVVAALLGLAGKSGLPPFEGGPVAVTLPVYGYATVIHPAGPIQIYEIDGGYGKDALPQPGAAADWHTAEQSAAQYVLDLAHQTSRPPICAFGFQDRFIDPNSLWLESSADFGYPIPSTWLDASYGATASEVSLWLQSGGADSANVLITAADMGAGEIPPGIDQANVALAAAASGFEKQRQMVLPDGTQLTFWLRADPPAFDNPYPFQPAA